jgi:hypothetical protein
MNNFDLEISNKKRTGKEIKIDGSFFGNSNIKFKIGTILDKHSPSTIYIETTFWLDLKDKNNYNDKYSFLDYDSEITRKLSNNIKSIYKKDLRPLLERNDVFPFYLDNIFLYDFPEKINYNTKRSFVCIEMDLHTLNAKEGSKEKFPLSNKTNTLIFDEALKICEIISKCDLLNSKLDFEIFSSKK